MISDLQPYPSYKDSGVEWLGDVPEHWKVRRIKNIFQRIIGGSTPSGNQNDYWDGEIIWITPTDVSKNSQLFTSLRKITKEGLKATSLELVPTGSLVITSRAPVGNVAVAQTELCTNQGCKTLIPDYNKIITQFGFNLLQTLKSEIQSLATGTTFTEISRTKLGDIYIPLPPLSEQTAIVRYLDYMDHRIRRFINAKKKLIALLEEEKQAIIHNAVTRGLDPDVRFKPSGVEWLGDVPENWEVRRLKTICTMRSGDLITGLSIDPEGDYPVYGGNGVRGYTSNYTHDGEFALIGRQGALCGNVHLVRGRFWASEHAVVVSLFPNFLLGWFTALLQAMNLNQYSISAAQPGLSVERMLNLLIPIPTINDQESIANHIQAQTSEINKVFTTTKHQIALLQEYRTRLIADVVTGKLDVREAAARLPEESRENKEGDTSELFDELDSLIDDETSIEESESEYESDEAEA